MKHDADPGAPARGIIIGVLLAIPLWVVLVSLALHAFG